MSTYTEEHEDGDDYDESFSMDEGNGAGGGGGDAEVQQPAPKYLRISMQRHYTIKNRLAAGESFEDIAKSYKTTVKILKRCIEKHEKLVREVNLIDQATLIDPEAHMSATTIPQPSSALVTTSTAESSPGFDNAKQDDSGRKNASAAKNVGASASDASVSKKRPFSIAESVRNVRVKVESLIFHALEHGGVPNETINDAICVERALNELATEIAVKTAVSNCRRERQN